MNDWVKNTGEKPCQKVDIKLSGDEPGWPGVECVRYSQNPDDWDWQTWMDLRITHWRSAKKLGVYNERL